MALSFASFDPKATVGGPDTLDSAYIVSNENGDVVGYVASSTLISQSPSVPDRVYRIKRWAHAVHMDEFKSGLQFQDTSRAWAAYRLAR
jgi:hypothetical protein